MHRCSIEVHDVNYGSLCDDRAIQGLLQDIAHALKLCVGAAPQGVYSFPKPAPVWVIVLDPVGWIVFNATPAEGWFSLDIASEKPVDKRCVVPLVERVFCEQDSVGRKVARSRLVKQGGS